MHFFSKICSICGIEKPLSFFSKLQGETGFSYGDVCAYCQDPQSALMKLLADSKGTGTNSGLKIDAKAKIKLASNDKIKKKLRQAKNQLLKKKLEKNKEKIKKKRRESAKQQRRYRDEQPEANDNIITIRSSSSETTNNKKLAVKQGALQKNREKEDALQKELANAQIDLTYVYLDPNITGQLKYQSAEFIKFKTLMLAGAFIGTIERQMGKIHGGELATLENIQDKTISSKVNHAPHLTPDSPTLFAKPQIKKSSASPKRKLKTKTIA